MSLGAELALACAVGGLLSIERKAVLQAGLSRPVVACTLVGLCLGDVRGGFLVGAPLELLYLGAASLGASLSDHETLASLAVGAASAVAGRQLGGATVSASALALLALIPFGVLGRALDRVDERVHQRFADRALILAQAGRYRAALRMNWRALWFPWGVGALGVLLGAGVGAVIARVMPYFPAQGRVALETSFLFASATCAAIGVRASRHPRAVSLAVGGAALTLVAVLAASGGR